MKRLRRPLCASVVAMTPAVALADDIMLVNQTGYEISSIHISSPQVPDWGPNLIEGATLVSGRSHIFRIPSDDGCFDILVIALINHAPSQWSRLDLCNLSSIVLHYDSPRRAIYADGGE